MKRNVCGVVSLLLASVANVGCQMEVLDESQAERETANLGEVQQALPFNCVGMCVAEYRACVMSGGSYADCAAGREACKGVCDEATCEPGEPGCCQGQVTCW